MSASDQRPDYFRDDTLLKDALRLGRLSQRDSFPSQLAKAQNLFQTYQSRSPQPFVLAPTLPVSQYADDLSQALSEHQVIIIEGATGSGKSTQVPKILLNLGLSHYGKIGITQPRRLAATMLCSRLRQETFDVAGDLIGSQVRHYKNVNSLHRVKVMTDGILLQEAIGDRTLSDYQAIILDEVHERSINTDLLLGLIKKALVKRPDLKVILLSATLNKLAFEKFFKGAVTLSIPGKTFPIDDHFLPEQLDGSDYWNRVDWALSQAQQVAGDILFFLPTQYDIFAHKRKLEKHYPNWEILPLFSRLDHKRQQLLFQPSSKRRLILTTNIAETSLTLPGIGVVIDEGRQKIEQYNPGLKLVGYPVIKASQSQIRQRRGRCGRLHAGNCFYLYTQQDFQAREEHTRAAILRCSTDSLVLQILSLGPDSLNSFEFFESPATRNIRESLSVLHILGLINEHNALTPLGKQVRYLPLEPRLAVIVEKSKEYGCFESICIIVAFFMGDDPRLMPTEAKDRALGKHRAYRDLRSDFMTIVNLYEKVQYLNNKSLKSFCQENFLSVIFIVTWKKNCESLAQNFRQRKPIIDLDKSQEQFLAIHRCLALGLVDKIFSRDKERYRGPRGVSAFIDRRSYVQKSSLPQFIMAFVVENRGQNYLNYVAPIESHFIAQEFASHLKIVENKPYLCEITGQVVQTQDSLLWGLALVKGKRHFVYQTNLPLAREIFIREIFASEHWHTKVEHWYHSYTQAYRAAIAARELTVMKDTEQIIQMALDIFPDDCCSLKQLEYASALIAPVTPEQFFSYRPRWKRSDFPTQIACQQESIAVDYLLDLRLEHDGYTLTINKELFERYPSTSWWAIVPGIRRLLFARIFEHLPKKIRHQVDDSDEIINYLSDAYCFPEPVDKWLLEQLRGLVDSALCTADLRFDQVEKNLFPYILLEDKGAELIEWGRHDNHKSQVKSQSLSLSQEDIFNQMSLFARAGQYYLPDLENMTLVSCTPNPHCWSLQLRSTLCRYAYDSLPLQRRLMLFNTNKAFKEDKRWLLASINRHLIIDIHRPLSLAVINNAITQLQEDFWPDICESCTQLSIVDKLSSLTFNQDLQWQSPFLKSAFDALCEEDFYKGIPALFVPRVEFWLDALAMMKQKQFQKSHLLKRFDEDFSKVLSSLKIAFVPQKPSVLQALYLEWLISLFCQPTKPIRPMSFKKILDWASESNNFLSL